VVFGGQVCVATLRERPPQLSHRSAVILTWCCTCGCFLAVGAAMQCVSLATLAPQCVDKSSVAKQSHPWRA
jgi:hypothetical protein